MGSGHGLRPCDSRILLKAAMFLFIAWMCHHEFHVERKAEYKCNEYINKETHNSGGQQNLYQVLQSIPGF